MNTVGLVTFHASHNFGSMLQAYATQNMIEKWGYSCDIVNFRMPSQKDYYSLYKSMKFGTVNCLGDLFMFPIHRKRKEAFDKFEKFMTSYFHLTEECNSIEQLNHLPKKYDIYVAGSDQIWSRTIPEFLHSEIDYTDVYFLKFSENCKKRVAFATSVGEATFDDLNRKKELLNRFNHISSREEKGATILEKITGQKIPTVLDPTLLLAKEEWFNIVSDKRIVEDKYVFLYTLKGIRPGLKWAKNITQFAKRNGLKVICISPFFPIIHPGIHNITNAGPLDFLNLIRHAEVVFTDSFHGTAFSLNFEKPVFSYVGKKTNDNRKSGLLKLLGADDRCLASFEEIQEIKDFDMDYCFIGGRLDEKRKESISVLSGFMKED